MSRSEKSYETCRWFCRNNVADALRIPFRLHLNEPMWRVPILEGGWSDRFVSGREISKWFKTVLSEKGCTVLSSFTPHGAKATLLSMAAKYGLGGRRPGQCLQYLPRYPANRRTGHLCKGSSQRSIEETWADVGVYPKWKLPARCKSFWDAGGRRYFSGTSIKIRLQHQRMTCNKIWVPMTFFLGWKSDPLKYGCWWPPTRGSKGHWPTCFLF